jgi:hypothetical protein
MFQLPFRSCTGLAFLLPTRPSRAVIHLPCEQQASAAKRKILNNKKETEIKKK